jgi:hypothetical protein
MQIELDYFRRLNGNNFKCRLEPHEKHAVHTFFSVTEEPSKYFTLVSPKTILSAWKNFLAKQWTFKRKKPGRPPVRKEDKQLVLKMKNENPSWGLRRIRDELKKLSINLSHQTISKILQGFRKKRLIKPTGAWKKFITTNWESIFSCDYSTVDIFGFKRFYVFFIIKLETRKIVQYGITSNPNIQFLRNQFSVFEYEYPGSTLIHDNSNELKYFPYEQYNFKHVATVPYSPNMNAYAERFVRSLRNDCLDWFIIFTEGQLRNIIDAYIDYYNNYRPHQGLKGIPNVPLDQEYPKTGVIKQKPLLFGLHNHYYREAA